MPARTSPPRILIVDDDSFIGPTLQRVLRQSFDVAVARSGLEALALLVRAPFTAVVTDIQMPGMSGFELVEAMRAREIDTPVVMMSGGDDDRFTAVGPALSPVPDLVLKPFTLATLVDAIERAIRGHRSMGAESS